MKMICITYIKFVDRLSIEMCRRDAETRFSAKIIVKKYVEIYDELLAKQ